jgi:hypothetical protein
MELSITQAPGLFKDAYSAQEYETYITANPLVPLASKEQLPQGAPLLGLPAEQLVVQPFNDLAYAKISPPSLIADIWVDAADPVFPLVDPSQALPSSLLVSNLPRLTPVPGTGPLLCSLPLVPYLATSTPDTDAGSAAISFRYTEEKFCAFETAALAAGESAYRDALQLSTEESNALTLRFAALRTMCGFSSLASPQTLTIETAEDGAVSVSMNASSGSPLYVLTLTPSASRQVSAPSGVSMFLARLQDLHRSGRSLDSLLDGLDPDLLPRR